MKIFAISDLHLSFGTNKPMDVFGGNWENYLDEIVADWNEKVCDDDIVLIAGDISWAMKLSETKADFEFLGKLKGKIVLIKGNHDYWWSAISKVRQVLPPNVFAIQNDAIKFDNVIICGTRGWTVPETTFETAQDEKIYKREVIRLGLTLENAKTLQTNDEEIICMLHFPPFNTKHTPNELTELFDKFNVNKIVYGHLHGKKVYTKFIFKMGKQEYFLTSCDLVGNKLILISDKQI